MVFDGFLINLGAVHAVRSVFCSLWTSLSPACKIMQNIGLLTNYCAKNLRISLPFGACALYAKKVLASRAGLYIRLYQQIAYTFNETI